MTTRPELHNRPPAFSPTRRRHLRLAGAALSTGLLLAACGSGSGAEQAEPAQEAIAAATELAATPTAEAPATHPVEHNTTETEDSPAKTKQTSSKTGQTTSKTGQAANKRPHPAGAEAGPAQPASHADRAAPTVDAAPGVLPDLQVVHVASGNTVGLRDLAVAGKPTLLWFWAPHCPACKAEAPKVVEFMSRHSQDVQFVGLGARDDLEQAREFLAETGTQDLQMVWDASGESWLHYKVANQPYFIVLDHEGDVKKGWYYTFNAAEVGRAVEPE